MMTSADAGAAEQADLPPLVRLEQLITLMPISHLGFGGLFVEPRARDEWIKLLVLTGPMCRPARRSR